MAVSGFATRRRQLLRVLAFAGACLALMANSSSCSKPTHHTSTSSVPNFIGASDCVHSGISVPPAAGFEDSITVTTDVTRTSLLISNVSELTLVVIPETRETEVDDPSYHGSYADQSASALAYQSLNADTLVRYDTVVSSATGTYGLAPYQAYFVPPQWSVCAHVPYTYDKVQLGIDRDNDASLAYFTAEKLAALTLRYATPASISRANSLLDCATGTLQLINSNPGNTNASTFLPQLFSTGSSCYEGLKNLLGSDDAVEHESSGFLEALSKLPAWVDDVKFLEALPR